MGRSKKRQASKASAASHATEDSAAASGDATQHAPPGGQDESAAGHDAVAASADAARQDGEAAAPGEATSQGGAVQHGPADPSHADDALPAEEGGADAAATDAVNEEAAATDADAAAAADAVNEEAAATDADAAAAADAVNEEAAATDAVNEEAAAEDAVNEEAAATDAVNEEAAAEDAVELPREASHLDAAVKEYLEEERADTPPSQRSLEGADEGHTSGTLPNDSVRAVVDMQWAAEGHELDKHTGDMVASAVSYENQRWYPLTGWTSTLLPRERAKWSSECGKYERRKEDWPVPETWGHPSTDCEWIGGWHADLGPHADGEGWEYAVSFKSRYSGKRAASDCVRRRGWIRRARVKPALVKPPPAADGDGVKNLSLSLSAHAHSDHSTKCVVVDGMKAYELQRLKAYESETALKTALSQHLHDALQELADTEKALASLRQQIERLCELQMNIVRSLQKQRRPQTSASSGVEVLNPVRHLYNCLFDYTLRYADNISDISGSSSQGQISRLADLCRAIDDARVKKGQVARKGVKRLEKAHLAASDAFARFIAEFRKARVESESNVDLWLLEREYVTACRQFEVVFEGYKGEVYAALTSVQELEQKCVDMMMSLGDRYCEMLRRVGLHDTATLGAGINQAWFEADRVPHRDLTRVGGRATVTTLSAVNSGLIVRQGLLESKGVLGWRKYYVMITLDHNMYLFDTVAQPSDDARAASTINLFEATFLPHPDQPSRFTLTGVTSGLLGEAQKEFQFRAGCDEDMVDWIVALKRARIHHVASPPRGPTPPAQ